MQIFPLCQVYTWSCSVTLALLSLARAYIITYSSDFISEMLSDKDWMEDVCHLDFSRLGRMTVSHLSFLPWPISTVSTRSLQVQGSLQLATFCCLGRAKMLSLAAGKSQNVWVRQVKEKSVCKRSFAWISQHMTFSTHPPLSPAG